MQPRIQTMLSVPGVAERLGVPTQRVHVLIWRGTLPAALLAGELYIGASDLEEWLESGGLELESDGRGT